MLLEAKDMSLVELQESRDTAWEMYQELVSRNEDRFTSLMHKQTEIVDQRLGLVQPQRAAQTVNPEPVRRRGNWNQIRAEYENRKKSEYWEGRIAGLETETAMNDTKVQAEAPVETKEETK